MLDAIGTRGYRTAGLVRHRAVTDVRLTRVVDRLVATGLLAPRRRGGTAPTRAGRRVVRQLRRTVAGGRARWRGGAAGRARGDQRGRGRGARAGRHAGPRAARGAVRIQPAAADAAPWPGGGRPPAGRGRRRDRVVVRLVPPPRRIRPLGRRRLGRRGWRRGWRLRWRRQAATAEAVAAPAERAPPNRLPPAGNRSGAIAATAATRCCSGWPAAGASGCKPFPAGSTRRSWCASPAAWADRRRRNGRRAGGV